MVSFAWTVIPVQPLVASPPQCVLLRSSMAKFMHLLESNGRYLIHANQVVRLLTGSGYFGLMDPHK